MKKLLSLTINAVVFISCFAPLSARAVVLSPWRAELVSQSYTEVFIKPESDITLVVSFKNTGTKNWHNDVRQRGYVALNVREKSQFEHRFWIDWEHPCRIEQKFVAPGETATCRFAFRAPAALGAYSLKLELAAERIAWIEGGVLTLPVIVSLDPGGEKAVREAALTSSRTEETIASYDASVGTSAATSIPTDTVAAVTQIPEPFDFRVGLFYRDEPITITNAGSFRLTDPSGNLLAEYGGGTLVTVAYHDGAHHITTPSGKVSFPHYLRLIPGERNADGVFELTNVENKPAWNPAINENKFRGIIEYRHNPATGRIWTINEISLETYMMGIGEIGERAPVDALKTTAIAARGYAYDMYRSNTKYSGIFHVANTQSDQLFGGYNHETKRPNFVDAVKATRGEMVAYESKPVITPYFSQSKGYTRAWHEIWGGKVKPWLTGVTVPCDEGQRGIGHGVGVSQQASICMAQAGTNYQDILKFFYTGTEVLKFY